MKSKINKLYVKFCGEEFIKPYYNERFVLKGNCWISSLPICATKEGNLRQTT